MVQWVRVFPSISSGGGGVDMSASGAGMCSP